MSNLSAKIKEEFIALLPPTLYFFIALHIVALIRALMTEGTGIAATTTISVAVAALILGKAVLLADLLPIINRYPHKPLIYNVTWKTLIYLVIAGLVHYLERLIDFSRQAGGMVAGNERLLAELVWPHFIAVQVLLFVLIVMYTTFREIARVIGTERMREMFFGSRKQVD